jgi:hypothetical protein
MWVWNSTEFWLSNFKDIYLVLVMKISKSIFWGNLFIYLGYGIKKKKSEKLFESAIYSLKKKSYSSWFWLIDWKSMYAILKPKYLKNSYLQWARKV